MSKQWADCIAYSPFPGGYWGILIPKGIVIGSLNYTKINETQMSLGKKGAQEED